MSNVDEGTFCPTPGCKGIIAWTPSEGCSCHVNPPCSACTSRVLYCPVCDWHGENAEFNAVYGTTASIMAVMPGLTIVDPVGNKPLDPSKIDWRDHCHSSSSMLKRGVCPLGMTKEQVLAVIGEGTFGGRWNYFRDGKFEYVAYTD